MGQREEKVVDHHPNILKQTTRLGRNSFGDFIRSWIIFHTNLILASNVFFVCSICYTIMLFCETLSNVIPKLYVIIEIIFISSLCLKTVLYSSHSLRFLQVFACWQPWHNSCFRVIKKGLVQTMYQTSCSIFWLELCIASNHYSAKTPIGF